MQKDLEPIIAERDKSVREETGVAELRVLLGKHVGRLDDESAD